MVCGYDELGAMYGLYNLEERMDLREAPFLPRHLDTSRHSLFKARLTLSGLGWMEWPDKYLAWLPRYGFDSIFDSLYANVNGQMIEPYFPQSAHAKTGPGPRPRLDSPRGPLRNPALLPHSLSIHGYTGK